MTNNKHLLKQYIISLTKITAAKNEAACSYRRLLGLYFMVVIFEATVRERPRSSREELRLCL